MLEQTRKTSKIISFLRTVLIVGLIAGAMTAMSVYNGLKHSRFAIELSWNYVEEQIADRYSVMNRYLLKPENRYIPAELQDVFLTDLQLLREARDRKQMITTVQRIEQLLHENLELSGESPVGHMFTTATEQLQGDLTEYNAHIRYYNELLDKFLHKLIANWAGFEKIEPVEISLR